eukprot:3603775-Rhodomonas_salina.4
MWFTKTIERPGSTVRRVSTGECVASYAASVPGSTTRQCIPRYSTKNRNLRQYGVAYSTIPYVRTAQSIAQYATPVPYSA